MNYLRILRARRITLSKFHTDDPQINSAVIKKIRLLGDMAAGIYTPPP
jgi:hypothetical protein